MSIKGPGENPDFKPTIRQQLDKLLSQSAWVQKGAVFDLDKITADLAQHAENLGMAEPVVILAPTEKPPFMVIEKTDYNEQLKKLEGVPYGWWDPNKGGFSVTPSFDQPNTSIGFRPSVKVDIDDPKGKE